MLKIALTKISDFIVRFKKNYFYLVILFCLGVIFSTQVVSADDAFSNWQKAERYLQLGQTDNARAILLEVLDTTSDRESIARTQGLLGNADFLDGKYLEAISRYQIAIDNSEGSIEIAAANNLVSTSEKLEEKYERDLVLVAEEGDTKLGKELEEKLAKQRENTTIYRRNSLILTEGNTDASRIRALLNAEEIEEAAKLVALLPPSPAKVSFLVELADLTPERLSYLLEARSLAVSNRDRAFVATELGKFYYSIGDYSQAKFYTDEAIQSAQGIFAEDLLYGQWHLLGDIYRQLGSDEAASESWQNAIASLQKIRGDLAIASRNSRLDFDERIDPIYKKLIELQIEEGKLKEARYTGDLRQLSELEAFFGDLCLQLTPQSNLLVGRDGLGTISIFVFDDWSAVFLQLPDGSYRSHRIDVKKEDFLALVKEYRKDLENTFSDDYLQVSQRLYDLLLRPLEASLAKVERLVFVNEGILRNVPMAALHDGEKFLIERYPISYSLSPSLVTAGANSDGDPLIFGLSVAVGDWQPLEAVIEETERVKSILGGEAIINEDFTVDEFSLAISNGQPKRVHIATHGKFTGILERSYLQAFDRPLSLSELESSLSGSNIDLLVLSACQTAAGNNKSVLGMAGVALRSGINEVVGSLWAIPDSEAADLMDSFYTYLERGFNVTDALRAAQLEIVQMDNEHPSIWSNFIVVDNG